MRSGKIAKFGSKVTSSYGFQRLPFLIQTRFNSIIHAKQRNLQKWMNEDRGYCGSNTRNFSNRKLGPLLRRWSWELWYSIASSNNLLSIKQLPERTAPIGHQITGELGPCEEPRLGLNQLNDGPGRLRIPLQDENHSGNLVFYVGVPGCTRNGSGVCPYLWVWKEIRLV